MANLLMLRDALIPCMAEARQYPVLLASILSLLSKHTDPAPGRRLDSLTHQRIDVRSVWPLVFRHITTISLHPDVTTHIVKTRTYTIIIVIRRTRGGGWVIDYYGCIINLGVMTKESLLNFLQSGAFRQAKAAARLGLRPQDVETRFLILDGMGADSVTFKRDVPEVTAVKLDGVPEGLVFQSWQEMIRCRGHLGDAEVVVAISRFDGVLAQTSALLDFFGYWTAGLLHITYEDKVMGGIGDPDSTGVFRDTMISIPRFTKFLREQQARKTISLARILRDQYCHTPLQTQQQQLVIDREEASIAQDAQSPLVESEVDQFTEIQRRMQRAVDQRAELASLRNSYLQADRPDLASAIDERIDELDEPLEATVSDNVGRYTANSDEEDVSEEENPDDGVEQDTGSKVQSTARPVPSRKGKERAISEEIEEDDQVEERTGLADGDFVDENDEEWFAKVVTQLSGNQD